MCVIIQVQHMLVSETTDESITQISHTGKCDDDPRVVMLALKYFIVKKK